MNTRAMRRAAAFILPTLFALPTATLADCPASRSTWFVEAGAEPGGDGSRKRPLADAATVEACTRPGDRIFVLPALDALAGPLQLKTDQTLAGSGRNIFSRRGLEGAHPQLAVRAGEGLGLADGVRVRNLHVLESGAALPGPTALVSGRDLAGTVRLERLRVSRTATSRGPAAIVIAPDADRGGQVDLARVEIEAVEAGPPAPDAWFAIGVRIDVRAAAQVCAAATITVVMDQVAIRNARSPVQIVQNCAEGGALDLDVTAMRIENMASDAFLIRNGGTIDADLEALDISLEPAARDSVLDGFLPAPFLAGVNFGLEYFGLPSARASRVKVRESRITGGVGPGVGFLQFPTASPAALTVDLGCLYSNCAARGLEETAGENAIFGNVAGAGDPAGNDYTSYLLAPDGLPLIFPFPIPVDPASADDAGATIELYADAPEDVAISAQGNYWGEGVGRAGLGTCLEVGLEVGEAGLVWAQNNPQAFSPENRWRCVLNNTAAFPGSLAYPTQPDTDQAVLVDPTR